MVAEKIFHDDFAIEILNLCQKSHSVEKVTALLLDDDPAFGILLESLIQKTGFVELLGSFNDPEMGFQTILEKRPQLLFLDMQMPNLLGSDIIKNLDYKPEIILISSSDSHGVEAFDLGVTDYLQKPVESYARFLKGVEKARLNILNRISTDQKFLFLKVDNSYVNVAKDGIKVIQAYGDYLKVITEDQTYLVKKKISEVELKLDNRFVRVHRSYIVNVEKVKNIEQNNLEIGIMTVPISQSYKEDLLNRISSI